ncbi:GCN5 family acetyltransferase [Pandoraea aquatica]|uniref:GCN5 family acetyltransferase n=2 Tax=Pandoraea aquatica TaxID=2508290 RepID=A0A5E4VM87_9BURK|nr:GNAT family N-acetyltransferase [Pandoraea aquatica]VVE13448.1 GCN5 family acetyltransferase [Pandoraea aquatica]
MTTSTTALDLRSPFDTEAPTITTGRTILRQWRTSDLPLFAALNADREVMRHFPTTLDRAQSDAVALRLAQHLDTHGYGPWALEIPGVTPFAGFVGLMRVGFDAPFVPAVEIGWRLARAWWSKGYATEAADAAARYAFETLGMDDLVSFTVPANVRSRAVMQRIGMRHCPDEDFLHPLIPPGHRLRRHVLYRLDAADWRQTSVERRLRD